NPNGLKLRRLSTSRAVRGSGACRLFPADARSATAWHLGADGPVLCKVLAEWGSQRGHERAVESRFICASCDSRAARSGAPASVRAISARPEPADAGVYRVGVLVPESGGPRTAGGQSMMGGAAWVWAVPGGPSGLAREAR